MLFEENQTEVTVADLNLYAQNFFFRSLRIPRDPQPLSRDVPVLTVYSKKQTPVS